jgi:hypothetical protein
MEESMDKWFRRRRTWLVIGVVAIIFLCLAVMGMGAMAAVLGRSGMASTGPLAGGELGVPPQAYHGLGIGRHAGFGLLGILGFGISLLFKLVFFGLLLLLLMGLIRRLFWGPRHWHPHYARPHHRGKPPTDGDWKHRARTWGPPPWAWHGCGEPDEVDDEFAAEAGKPDTASPASGEAE